MDGEQSVLDVLCPQPGDVVLDVTLGLGGHAAAFFEAIGPSGRLIGLDADAKNLASASERLRMWKPQLTLFHANFGDVVALVTDPVDILFADLGVSSPHFDDPSRGFTFRNDAPLDLRFDQTSGDTAADLLAEVSQEELTEVFRRYGELRGSHRLASAIIERRSRSPFQTTKDMRNLVEEVFGYRAPGLLPQIFQALRIWVNDELTALERLLASIPKLLKKGGRAGVISYHSLEDRLVKHSFRALSAPERDTLTGGIARAAPFEVLTRKAVVPSEAEIRSNPRARSARFRAIRRSA